MKSILLTILVVFLTSQSFTQWDKYPRPDEGVMTGGMGINWIDGQPYYRVSFRPEVSFANVGIGLDLNLDFDSQGKLRTENFNDEGVMTGGMGINWIDGQPYYRVSFRPEVSFSDFGIGLDLNLDFDSQGKLRTENFNETSDYLSIIRYVRYGVKNDPVFIKVGALDYYTLGHGSIMQHYNNSPTYDNRRIGLVFDLDLGKFGVESIYSSFSPQGVFAIRGYVRPLQLTSATDLPIISNLEVGASFASDMNKDAGIVNGTYDQATQEFNVTEDLGSLSIVGFDLGLPLLNSSVTDITLYVDYAKIIDFGSGVATGVKFDFDLSSLLTIAAKFERRFNQGQYVPAYFNTLHEINRFQVDSSTGTFTSKAKLLSEFNEDTKGWYGDLLIRVS